MAHKCYPERVDYVDTVLEVTKKLFDNIGLVKYYFSLIFLKEKIRQIATEFISELNM